MRKEALLCLSLMLTQSYAFASSETDNTLKQAEVHALAQKGYTVKGIVKDQLGEPLGGVSIVVKGTTVGTTTDLDGNFTLNVPGNNVTLSFSFIGFKSQEVSLKGQTDLNIVLSEDAEMLDEVVVVGYGSMKRSDVATAISSVKPEDMNLAGANSRDVRQLLDGKVTADKFYVERATPEATLSFIKEDIGKSESYFGTTEINNKHDKTMWSKAATLMLKAEIYMWAAKVSINGYTASGKSDLEVAKNALNGIIGKFQLLNKFSDVFSTSNRNNAEVIFTLHFADGEATNWGGMFLYQDAVFIGQVYGRDDKKIETDTLNLKGTGGVFRHEYTEDFWKSYDEKDTRRDATFLEYYTKKNKEGFGCVMQKAIGSINSNNNRIYDTDFIVYRYADALLMMAEVENGLGNPCAGYINEVRKRAYGSDYEANKYTEGNYAENELAILHERDKEFVWEGKRWFDVVRMHDANGKSLAFSATANYPADKSILDPSEEYKLLWPIDVDVMSVNPLLKQTPGYEK